MREFGWPITERDKEPERREGSEERLTEVGWVFRMKNRSRFVL